MRSFILAILACLFICRFASADDIVHLPRGKVHEGDYFTTGRSIEISGIVQGDVYLFGSQIRVDGRIEGDVIATGATVDISGEVLGNVRVIGGQVELSGIIGRNVTVIGGNIELASSAVIGRNAIFTGGMIDLAGEVRENVTLTASNVRLSGEIGGNVKAYAGQLRASSKMKIGGDLEYSSSSEALIDTGAQIEGTVTYHHSAMREFFYGRWRQKVVIGSRIAGLVMNFLFSFVIGWLFIKLFPNKLKRTLLGLKNSRWRALGMGVLVVIILPISCLLLFVTILGFPLALALVAISLLGFYAAKIFPILWVSNLVFPKMHLKKNSLFAFFLGLVGFFLLIQIPVLGALLSVLVTLLGLGSVVLGRLPKKR